MGIGILALNAIVGAMFGCVIAVIVLIRAVAYLMAAIIQVARKAKA